MRPWHKAAFIGSVPVAEIVRALDPGRVETLSLEVNDSVGDLSQLLVFSSLKSLWLQRCPHVSGLAALSRLPLTDLTLHQVADLSGLRDLHSLTRLSLDQHFPYDTLADALPLGSPLEYLYLGPDTLAATGLTGLDRWPTLATLCLAAPDDPLTAADWQQVAALPALKALVMYAPFSASTYALDVMPELPAVEELRIPGNIREHSLATLAARLPSVRKVTVKAYGVTLDLTEYTRHFPDADISDDLA
ncbi:hypothetical protein ACRAWF_10855 [Streptomyces sp. L7]